MAVALHPAFGKAFDRLLAAFKRHEDVDRDPDNFPEIGDVRAELEDARAEVRATRPSSAGAAPREPVVKAAVSAPDRDRVRAQIYPQN